MVADNSDENEDEYQGHVTQLQTHWREGRRQESHILQLLRVTRRGRQRWITSLPDGHIKPILQEYPCFYDGHYVSLKKIDEIKIWCVAI